MPYTFLPYEAISLIQSPAYLTNDLRRVIHDLTKINFSVQGDRTAAKELLSNLTEHYDLISIDKRFPNNETLVFLDSADWNKKWQDLQSSLDYKSLEKETKKTWSKSVLSSGESVEDKEFPKWDFNDAAMAFRNSLRSISDQLGRREGTYNRSIFESKFLLVWSDISNMGYIKTKLSSCIRLRAFLISVNQYHNGNWPGVGNVISFYDINDNSPITDDYLYLWSSRTQNERALLRIDIASCVIIECSPVVTND